MATGYTRQSTITTGIVITAAIFNDEYNQLLAAFDKSTGHNHDSTTGGGALIPMTSAVTGTLPLGNGGTGATTLTDGGIVLGSGTSALTALARGTTGQILIGSTSGDPVMGALAATASTGILVTLGDGTVAIAGIDATDSIKGVASFASGDFGVSSGAVTLAVDVVQSLVSDSGTATATSNTLLIAGGTGITTSGSGTTLTVTNNAPQVTANTTVEGASEHATATEIDTGTDNAKVLTSGLFNDSKYGTWTFEFMVGTPAVADSVLFFETPVEMAGMDIIEVKAHFTDIIATGAATSIQIVNSSQSNVDVLSTNLTIDDGERSSSTAGTGVVIDTGQDDITSGDIYRLDIDQVGSTLVGSDLLIQITARTP